MELAEITVFLYYLVFICSFKFFYAFLLTAYQAWLPEITDEDERPLVSSIQNTSNWVANGMGLVIGFITPLFFLDDPINPGLTSTGLTIVLVFAIVTVILYLPSIIFIREKPGLVISKRNIREETSFILKNETYVKWIIVVGFLSFSLSAITTQIVGYVQTILQLTSIDTLIIPALALLVSIIAFMYIWIKYVNVFGKGKLLGYGLLGIFFLMLLTPFLGQIGVFIPSYIVATIYFIPLAACMAIYYLLGYVIPADIAHVDELETGQGRAGIYEGFKGVPLNIFQAAAAFLLGWFMEYSVATTGSTVFGYLWWGPLFAPFLIIAVLILQKTNIDPDFAQYKVGLEE